MCLFVLLRSKCESCWVDFVVRFLFFLCVYVVFVGGVLLLEVFVCDLRVFVFFFGFGSWVLVGGFDGIWDFCFVFG